MTRVQHSSPKKNRLIGAIQAGKSIPQAAQIADIPYGTAKKIWSKYCTTGSTKNWQRSGCPSKVTERTKRALVRTVRNNRRMPFGEVGNTVKPSISATTVREHLAREGYHRRVAKKVPYLTKLQKRKRAAWAKQAKDSDWSKVIWSDECYVYLGDSHGRVFVTRCISEELEDDCLVPAFKQSSIRVMVWGCIMKGKKGPLVVLEYPGGKEGGMNAKRYQEQVLEGALRQFYTAMESERGNVQYQQDNAPSHTAVLAVCQNHQTMARVPQDHCVPTSAIFSRCQPH